ncbi:MAG: hypothetical protein AAF409_14540 [Pseudomonadota bacterium]
MTTTQYDPHRGASAKGPATRSAAVERAENDRPGYFDDSHGRNSAIGLIGAAAAGAAIWAALFSYFGLI